MLARSLDNISSKNNKDDNPILKQFLVFSTNIKRRNKAQPTEELKERFDSDVDAMDDVYNAQTEKLEEVLVRARSSNIQISWLGLAWRPAFSA